MKGIIVQVLIRAALIIVGVLGIILTVFSDNSFMGNTVAFLYFTVQSNITIISIEVVFLIDAIRQLFSKKTFINDILLYIKYAFVVAITITCLVFVTMLMPTLGASYLLSYGNFSLHLIVPILAVTDFFIFDKNIKLTKVTCLFGTGMPLYYLIFFLIGIPLNVRYIGDSVAPYFFLDFKTLTWFRFTSNGPGVFYWILILLALISALCYAYYFLMKLRQRKK